MSFNTCPCFFYIYKKMADGRITPHRPLYFYRIDYRYFVVVLLLDDHALPLLQTILRGGRHFVARVLNISR